MMDMKQSPTGAPTLLSDEAEEGKYPYGLCLHLGKEELKKLGLGEGNLPKIGEVFMLHAMVEVVSTAKDPGQIEDGLQMGLQVTQMELLPPDAMKDEGEEMNEQQKAYKQIEGMYK